MFISEKYDNGVRFVGESGWIWVARGKVLDASDPRMIPTGIKDNEVHLHATPNNDHHLDWLTSVRNRTEPVAPAEVGHRSCTACLLAHAGMKLGRELKWDPAGEHFLHDEEANALLGRPQRKPYGTDYVTV